jgi:hypothetical protein
VKPVSVEFPLVLKGSNAREHHMARSRRVDRERSATRRALSGEQQPGPLLVVRLTRLAPRTLDPGDNLPTSLKGVRDQVATWLGVDDRSPLVRFEYAQEKVSQPRKARPVDRVRVEVLAAGERLDVVHSEEAALQTVFRAMDELARTPRKPRRLGEASALAALAIDPKPARAARLSGPTLAALAVSATHHPKKPATCLDCASKAHEQPWDGRCECPCHNPEVMP